MEWKMTETLRKTDTTKLNKQEENAETEGKMKNKKRKRTNRETRKRENATLPRKLIVNACAKHEHQEPTHRRVRPCPPGVAFNSLYN